MPYHPATKSAAILSNVPETKLKCPLPNGCDVSATVGECTSLPPWPFPSPRPLPGGEGDSERAMRDFDGNRIAALQLWLDSGVTKG
jgi:hypothetical protein